MSYTLGRGPQRIQQGSAQMLELGPIEMVIILALAWFAFRHVIARRWPDYARAFNVAFFFAVGLMLLFGLLARLH
jgi:hypothetical protein